MRYEKLSQKLTFYKAFFSPQWKFLIHTILQCLSAKTTAWNEFSSTMSSAIICLATNQKFNFSKYIFESMVKNLDNKIFRKYRAVGKVFLEGKPFVSNYAGANQAEMGEWFNIIPTDLPSHTHYIKPINISTQEKQRSRKAKRKDLPSPVIPQPSGPTTNVADEVVYEEMDDSLERAATTATSLDAEQDRGVGPALRKPWEVTIASNLGLIKLSNDPMLAKRLTTLRSGGLAGYQRFTSLEGMVKRTREEWRVKNSWLKRFITKKRKINDIDKDAEITLVDETQGRYSDDLMFYTGVLDDEKVFAGQDMGEKEIKVAKKEVSTAAPVTTTDEVVTTASVEISTANLTETIADDLTLAKSLIEIRSAKPKVKGVVIGEQKEPVKMKKKDQISLDEELAFKLQAEEKEEERLAREKAQQIKEANIVSWDKCKQ
ncbi:hypothetical protein Tco_0847833 [Tanacetum coccineum]